ncbi:PstC family ABC transporter permease [Desulforegula conservatrix]|uniref:PstC family ABC transporter permease n=1 Tax=Desulforegula conservatrix TaxID=153026 RepID=UPI0018DC10D1|nr:ABC transporter permease subunit [Desulforegula conservatrix]
MTVLIFAFMLFSGLPLIKSGGLLHTIYGQWLPQKNLFGIYPMIRASIVLTIISVFIAFPLSFSTSAISVLGSGKLWGKAIKGWTGIMTGIPTVIYGFVGVILIVPFFRMMKAGASGYSVIAASSVLAVMISPTMILVMTDFFEKKTMQYRKTALSLGADDLQIFFSVTVPASLKGMLAALVLGAGRAAGDTMIALMIAGNSAAPEFSLTAPARTLTSHIALIMNADFESLAFRSVFVCGAALYCFSGISVIIARMIARKDRS